MYRRRRTHAMPLQGDWKVAAAPPSAPSSARKLAMRTPRAPASAAANTNKFIGEASSQNAGESLQGSSVL
jgi:hypothetical protein